MGSRARGGGSFSCQDWSRIDYVRRRDVVHPACNAPAVLNALPPARRVRRIFMCLVLTIAILAFVVVGADVLFEQWIEGRASALFVFGTACLIAGACTALVAVVAVITSVSRPTVEMKYPLAQKCWPTKFRFFSPYTRAKWIALFPLINPIT